MKPCLPSSVNPDWAIAYIGREYDHCGSFVAEVYRDLVGVELPQFVPASESVRVAIQRIREGKQEAIWQRLATPTELCAVGLGKGKHMHHVGIYTLLDGGKVVHADDGRPVAAHTVRQLQRQGFQRIEFYAPPTAG